jgi:two-component system alkaline phosphatase synthesis response regulator PhoP
LELNRIHQQQVHSILYSAGARHMLKKILIVDDEPFIRALLEQTLEDFEDEGVELISASDGLQAWQRAQQENPDLVILDVMMPHMSGYQVCERIRSEPNLKGTYVIMLTAKGQQVDRLQSEQVGADEYITKPFDPDYLICRAADILGIRP